MCICLREWASACAWVFGCLCVCASEYAEVRVCVGVCMCLCVCVLACIHVFACDCVSNPGDPYASMLTEDSVWGECSTCGSQ